MSIEACDLYAQEQKNGASVGYRLPQQSDAYFWAFKNKLDDSLDLQELQRVYARIYAKPFSFSDEYQNEYTRAVINVKFRHVYKAAKRSMNTKELREYFYQNGFCVDGVRYVRYKRSAGSSRQGKCLFIDERLYADMARWSECGLVRQEDLASWEAYKSLSLSSVKGTLQIPIEGILFVPDFLATFQEEAVCVETTGGELVARTQEATITNDIWDGESLIDESLFTGQYSERHMLLLRNKFFKSCAFRTKLQKWIGDRNITLDSLKARGFVTLATDIRQIVMVTTPNSLKYLKFVGGLSRENVQGWASHVDSAFGVVKWDKRTSFFSGRMVRSSYQLLNTIALSREQAEELMRPSVDYLATLRSDVDFMRYHFSDVCAKESDDAERELADGLAQRAEVIFKLMHVNNAFRDTALYAQFRNDVVKSQKDRLLEGHVLLRGTNATLFGNGPELLKYIAGERVESTLKSGQIRCGAFKQGQQLLCARSPHVTMGNLYLATNNLEGEIWNYFDLGDNVVCVNAIGENVQQKLNGCDYDSDTMLVTDDALLVERVQRFAHLFKVPVCNVQSSGRARLTLSELDYSTSENKIGEIVNLSQKLNSMIWDRLNRGDEKIDELYLDVCKLAVLSGLEIDRAKRAYSVNAGRALEAIRNKYDLVRPTFFKQMDRSYFSGDAKQKEYALYETAMEYIYQLAAKIDFRKGKKKRVQYVPVSAMLEANLQESPQDDLLIEQAVRLNDEYKQKINGLYKAMSKADEDERDIIYDRIYDVKRERDERIARLVQNENILMRMIMQYEKAQLVDWHLYAPLLGCALFERILKRSRERLSRIVEDPAGEYALYAFRYRKE